LRNATNNDAVTIFPRKSYSKQFIADFLDGFLPFQIGIVGVGYAGFDSMTPGLSTRELMFEAAIRAYEDAGIDPRKDVQSFVCCTEDFWEGISITDEYMPDQLGAVLRPLCTISSDGIIGLATACMHIMSGIADVAVVESHSKISDVVNPDEIVSFGYDPVYTHHHFDADPRFLAGMEMARYLKETGTKREYCAQVAVKNKKNALSNSRGVHGADIDKGVVMNSQVAASPLTELESSKGIDASIVFVLASAQKARKLGDHPVWIRGIGWSSDTPVVEDRDFARAEYVEQAAGRAYKMANVKSPAIYFDLAEVDDTYSYKELQSLEALKIASKGKAGKMVETGAFDIDGRLPVNASGGSLGVGHLLEATGLHRTLEAVMQLRGQAGRLQVPRAKRALVQSWRGIPTATGAVAVLGN
jgi:acetyl-CoA C-acetyltransferase